MKTNWLHAHVVGKERSASIAFADIVCILKLFLNG